ncbi:TPA: hypothetical protein ACH3X1_016303 [Trebouxia sp. C0004]
MTDALAKWAAALNTFDSIKHNFRAPGQVEKALNSIALDERILLFRGSDSDIVERLSPYDQVEDAAGSALVDARGSIQNLLTPLDSWPSPEDFLQYLVRPDGRKIPVSQRAFAKVLIALNLDNFLHCCKHSDVTVKHKHAFINCLGLSWYYLL